MFVNNSFVELEKIIEQLKATFSNSDDLKIRELKIGDVKCACSYIDGGIDRELFEQSIIKPLMQAESFAKPYEEALKNTVHFSETAVPLPAISAPGPIAEGDVVLFIDGEDDAFAYSLRKPEKRSITEPPTSSVLKGPREGFIEELKTNLSMMRRRLKTPDLVVRTFQVGRYSTTSVAVLHIKGVADRQVIKQIYEKISKIDIDGVIDSAYVLAFIQEKRTSFFIQAGTTEKPDVAGAKLLEGRVAILVDGSPIAITLPYLIFEDVQDGYDYYSGDWRASMIRLFRVIGALLTVLLPGAYIALQTFHLQLLPLKFLMTLMAATTGIPFPPAIEMLVVLMLFEVLNQASIRMPRYLGISLSVVGAIVLGDTAVKSGLISSPSVLVIALSAIGIFCVPDQVGTISILRLLFLCISAVTGFVGMVILAIVIIGYLSGLDNFGTPYLAPYAPRINPDLQDGIMKVGTVSMVRRPYSIPTANRTRIRKH